jgi:hypothetical protein
VRVAESDRIPLSRLDAAGDGGFGENQDLVDDVSERCGQSVVESFVAPPGRPSRL